VALFDHLVGAGEQHRGNGEAERFGGLFGTALSIQRSDIRENAGEIGGKLPSRT
jgi:hypothetical protein